MSVWSSIFSRDPSKDFLYDLFETVFENPEVSLWSVHKAKKKGTEEYFTVFSLRGTEHQLNAARDSLKRFKTLRHPGILTFVDALETDKLVNIVTEYCQPLSLYLDNLSISGENRDQLITWGFYQLAGVLKFLNVDCQLCHNNVNISSAFVTQSGQWKLGSLDFVFDTVGASSPPSKPYGLSKYEPPETKSGVLSKRKPWQIDIWGLGCLLWEIYNGVGQISGPSSLRQPKKLPKMLHSIFAQMICQNPEQRLSPDQLLDKCRQPGGPMRNPFVEMMVFLDEFQIKDDREKVQFFGKLNQCLEIFPDDIAKYRILPQLINAYQYGNAGSAVLLPLMKLSRLLGDEEYQKIIVPCVVKLFSSNDRATRVKMLQQIDQFVPNLHASTVNDKIFPAIVSGFLDSNPAVREITVKAMVPIAEKLNYNNLNEELMKHFARLQGKDDEAGIRTNTTICLGKIACFLHPQNRQKILLSAFTRAVRDPFAPSRTAGVLALSATQQYYPLIEVAHKIMPTLSSLTVDPDKGVRDHAFKAIQGFLEKLHKASENPSLIAEMEAEVNAASGQSRLLSAASSVVPSWAGWAIGALHSKFYKSAVPSGTSNETHEQQLQNKKIAVASDRSASVSTTNRSEVQDADGWGAINDDDDTEDWGEIESKPSVSSVVSAEDSFAWDDNDDDSKGWGKLEVDDVSLSGSNASQSESGTSGAKNLLDLNQRSPNDEEFFNQLITTASANSRLTPSSQSKLSNGPKKAEANVSGWDTWADNEEVSIPDSKSIANEQTDKANKLQQRRAELEEKRIRRLNMGGGPLKLGGKKLT